MSRSDPLSAFLVAGRRGVGGALFVEALDARTLGSAFLQTLNLERKTQDGEQREPTRGRRDLPMKWTPVRVQWCPQSRDASFCDVSSP